MSSASAAESACGSRTWPSTASESSLTRASAAESALAESTLDERVLGRLDESRPGTQARQKTETTAIPAIRPLEDGDREAVLHIARELVRNADTYAFEPETTDEQLWEYWAPIDRGKGFVTLHDDQVVGIFVIRPNHPGPGAHVANASYAVRADVRGLGVGRRMGEESLVLAGELGFSAMQFNIVIETNKNALRLWTSIGFRIIGTVPEGFRLPSGKFASHHIMYRSL